MLTIKKVVELKNYTDLESKIATLYTVAQLDSSEMPLNI